MDRTLILVKPDAFARSLSGEIIARFERKGLKIVALRHMTVTPELAERHYAEHSERPFFGELVEFITSGPIVAMVLEGPHAVRAARQVIGATDRIVGEVTSRPVTFGGLSATLYKNLGIDCQQTFVNNAGRPIPILPSGTPIAELL